MTLPRVSKKQKAWVGSALITAAGAALFRWVDNASGVALMGVGIFMIGKLGREWLPAEKDYTDGEKTPVDRPSQPRGTP